ncbi:major histocompatibility complex class I-related gene protein-like [Hippocampus comes]|uniref:major histocompatibility complex class I-related gene protein-like n=1 Tax=Hippocampus comes TaxID=109280 RepID=UPI00094E26E0|nr:PREDICTED: major histocompatibility complex class I-related gene protein-like [Hippocampus comes]
MWKMKLLPLFVVAVQFRSVTPVIHSLKYFQTTSSEIPNFPDYLVVGHVNDVPISHYDSKNRKFEAKHEWMNKMETDVAHYWERLTQYNIDIEQTFKVNFEIAKERFNQTGGVHMIQVMTGCEWDDETDEVVDGWEHLSYDGEDFLSFELQTQRWIAIQQQAFDTKHKWDQLDNLNQYWKHYITEICPHWLKKLMSHGGDFLMRTELPVMSLLQKTPSSPITCHVTGFYPYKAALFWRKDGADLHEDVEMGETLPNHDGTFQMTAHLKAELPADAEDRYECVFQLSGVEGDMVTKLDRRLILSNERDREEEIRKMTLAVAIPVALLVLLALLLVVLVKLHKSKRANYTAASVDGDSELTPRPPSEPDSDPTLKSVSEAGSEPASESASEPASA